MVAPTPVNSSSYPRFSPSASATPAPRNPLGGASNTAQPSREVVLEQTYRLGSLVVPRLFVGLWQLSSPSWGSAPTHKVRRAMLKHVQAGCYAFVGASYASVDYLMTTKANIFPPPPPTVGAADHYGTAEQQFGHFRETLPDPSKVVGATKWCVFNSERVTRELVREAIRERNQRMCSDHVDLLQFHWQDYEDKSYLDALRYLKELRAEKVITEIGLCNFDSARTEEIVNDMGPGVIVSNQVQFSLIDTRPLDGMGDVCEKYGVKLLTYGTLCGGFLSDKWLGVPEPEGYSGAPLTPSQRKYHDVIVKVWGDWPLFQSLLRVLRNIGDRHGGKSISNVATRWVLEHPFVGSVIVGNRLGMSEHIQDNDRVFLFSLTPEDKAEIEAVLDRSHGPQMARIIGDCGAEYRVGS